MSRLRALYPCWGSLSDKCESAAVEKQLPRVVAAFFIAMLLPNSVLNVDAQVKQALGIKTLTLGLVFQGPKEPIEEHFRPFVEYTGRKLAARHLMSVRKDHLPELV
ncbi:MAG TPA: hypothetical protein VMO00_20755 [Methylomirabilota bacterium]|nr:hypothetical protein [Methylomirabilota bacterium]